MPKKKKPSQIAQEDPALELVRLELVANDCEIENIEGIPYPTILEEIRCALNPDLHEGRIPPYGSILCPGELPNDLVDKRYSPDIIDKTFIRGAADGRKTFIVYSGSEEPELCSMGEDYGTELALINLSRSCFGLVLKRRDSGLTTLVYRQNVYTIRNRQWLRRKPILGMTSAIRQHYAAIDSNITRRILELCCYILSPLGIGTTLVWFMHEPSATESSLWAECPDMRHLGLLAQEQEHYQTIAHLARHQDGAFLLGPKSDIRSLGAHLKYSPETAARVSPYRGTRHTSAKCYSFEHERALVFVVSEDGYVSVFSDGFKISDSPLYPAFEEAKDLKKMVPEKAKDVSSDSFERNCHECVKRVRIEQVTIIGSKEMEEAICPYCGKVAYSAMCWSLTALPLKTLPEK